MFHTVQPREVSFTSLDEVMTFVAGEKARIVRVPIEGLWRAGARFHGDMHFGAGSAMFKVNELGFRTLCDLLSVPERVMMRVRDHELTSSILNDLLRTAIAEQGKAHRSELVIDEELEEIIGIVGESYVGYSNGAFINDILMELDSANSGSMFPEAKGYDFSKTFSINTRLFVRFTSHKVKGVVQGRGGAGDDVSVIGFQASNSMAGGHAVRLSHFILRLICANGLIAPVGGSKGRVIHSGTEIGFRVRLQRAMGEVAGAAGRAKAMIESLGDLRFSPERLAQHLDPNMLFRVIPERDLRAEATAVARTADYRDLNPQQRAIQTLADVIEQIPLVLGGREALATFTSYYRDGATMFDLINAITEHARELPLRHKIVAEARAGDLADWIAGNKRKFA